MDAVKMKLSVLVPHTSNWVGVPRSTVESVAKYLRPAGLLSSSGRGPGGAEMTHDDKINLLLGVCGVEVASRAAEHVRIWRRLIRYSDPTDQRFAFLKAETVRDFFVHLVTDDLNGGALDAWLNEAGDKYKQYPALKAAARHKMTLDFYVDEFSFTLIVSRFTTFNDDEQFPDLRQSKGDTIEVVFGQGPPGGENEYQPPRRNEGYKAGSRLIRRLDEANIRGWGACLLE